MIHEPSLRRGRKCAGVILTSAHRAPLASLPNISYITHDYFTEFLACHLFNIWDRVKIKTVLH